MSDTFGKWWSKYESKTRDERIEHFNSLSQSEQNRLQESFLKDGWSQLFCQNHINEALDYIKEIYGIDLIDIRIKALKFGRVFLFDKDKWEDIEQMILEYDPLFNSDIIFGGLQAKSWGRKHQFYRVTAKGT